MHASHPPFDAGLSWLGQATWWCRLLRGRDVGRAAHDGEQLLEHEVSGDIRGVPGPCRAAVARSASVPDVSLGESYQAVIDVGVELQVGVTIRSRARRLSHLAVTSTGSASVSILGLRRLDALL